MVEARRGDASEGADAETEMSARDFPPAAAMHLRWAWDPVMCSVEPHAPLRGHLVLLDMVSPLRRIYRDGG